VHGGARRRLHRELQRHGTLLFLAAQQSHHAPTFHCGALRADAIGISVARI